VALHSAADSEPVATLDRKPPSGSGGDAGPVLRRIAVGCVVIAFAGLWLGIKIGAGIIFGFYPLVEGVMVLAAIFMPIAAARTLRRRATAWLIIGLVGAMAASTGVGLAWWKVGNDRQHDRTVAATRALAGLRGQHGGITLAIRANATQIIDLRVDTGHSGLANSTIQYWNAYCYTKNVDVVAFLAKSTGPTTATFQLSPSPGRPQSADPNHPWPYCTFRSLNSVDIYIPMHR
jgi:hypothetical protein